MSSDYNEDEELLLLVNEEVEEATDILLKKYYFIIPYYLRKYKTIIKKLNIDTKDLIEETIISLINGINFYQEAKEASLKTYLQLCVERRIRRYIESENTIKSKILKSTISLEKKVAKSEVELIDIISDNGKYNPELILFQKEDYKILLEKIEARLSDNERKVFNYLLLGLNYHEISKILNKNTKSIDNTIQRIKNKLKEII